jgi:energy-coupling factor transporter transmembrane protein EcfT
MSYMGFNPYRKFRARRADYVFVVAAAIATVALVVWAFTG